MTTIIFFSPFIVIDDRCQATVSGKVIWKCNDLLKLLEKPATTLFLHEREYTPQNCGNDFVILGGFNISSTIHANGTADDVIKGWNMFDKDMGRDVIKRLFQPFFYHAVSNAKLLPVHKLRNKEPYLIELLRLSYWYYKCSLMQVDNTFPS